MTHDEALNLFRETGALLEDHFILRSGLRSRQFFQCALALQQGLAIARAFVRNAPILVLDEATASLDSKVATC